MKMDGPKQNYNKSKRLTYKASTKIIFNDLTESDRAEPSHLAGQYILRCSYYSYYMAPIPCLIMTH